MPILGYAIILTCILMMDRSVNLYKTLKNECLRLDRETMNLDFLRNCKKAAVIPSFLRSRRGLIADRFASLRFGFECKCLMKTIKEKYAHIARIRVKIDALFLEFTSSVPTHFREDALRRIDYYRSKQRALKFRMQLSKFEKLTADKKNVFGKGIRSFEYLNLSSRQFSDFESHILEKGLKHIVRQPVRAEVMVPQMENVVRMVSPEYKEEARNFLYFEYTNALKRQPKSYLYEYQVIKTMTKDPSICFLQTDKTNKLAILDSTDYKVKMNDCIGNMGCIAVNKDPLAPLAAKVKDLVKYGKWPLSVTHLVKENKTGIIPLIFARLKDHKPNLPLRPIVPKTQAPTYFLEKAFAVIITEILPSSLYTIRSTQEFINRLEAFVLPKEFLMASLDVVQLFPSIDIDSVRTVLVNIISSSSLYDQDVKVTLVRALNLILTSNYFSFDNIIYKQQRGAPMGSPISGLLAECVMSTIDHDANSIPPKKPALWMRYVDDIFVIWEHSEGDFKSFTSFMNTLNPSIKFTSQLEVNMKLPYLDVLLEKEGGTIVRSVYRKPSAQICTIPQDALAPNSYKMAAFSSYVVRAMRVCSPSKKEDEFNTIRSIARLNGFSVSVVNDLIRKHSLQFRPTANIKDMKKLSIQYIPKFFEKSKQYFMKKHNILLIAKTFPKLNVCLSRSLSTFPPLDMNGIYEIPFTDSSGTKLFYIGMTHRKLKTRIKEHKSDIRSGRLSTALARKFADDPIQVDFSAARIIAPFESVFMAKVRESILISIRQKEVCNDQLSFNVPTLWMSLF